MDYFTRALREHQELAIFLTLAIGFLIGRLKIGSFSLGTVVGTLLAGVAAKHSGIPVVKYASDVEEAAKHLDYADRKTVMTDMIFVGIGIFLGGLVGLLTIVVAGLPLTLTASGGALIMGLVFGWLRAVNPTFGRIPDPAMWVFDTVGLTVFMACVGLAAGPSFFSGLQKSGISLVLVGLVIAILPHTVAILFGRYVLKMNPVIVLGACSGAGTITAALRAIQEEAKSELPALGYTVPYAVGNILLTAWGPVLIAMMS